MSAENFGGAAREYADIDKSPEERARHHHPEDVFTIGGRGTVVTGRVARGVLAIGEKVELVGREELVVVTGIEAFHRPQTEARAGENVGLLLRGVHHSEVERGVVAAKPGSIAPHVAGEAELYVLEAKEGGRSSSSARSTSASCAWVRAIGRACASPSTERWASSPVCASPSAKEGAPSAPASCSPSRDCCELRRRPPHVCTREAGAVILVAS